MTRGPVGMYALSAVFLLIATASSSLLISYFIPIEAWSIIIPASIRTCKLVQAFDADNHYKYLIPLLIPTTAWFAIANWVGWEYFRFA